MLIDSHAHLNLTEHYSDLEKTHQDMQSAGVEAAIVVGIDLETSQKALSFKESWIFPTAGIHPQTDNFDDNDPNSWKQLEEMLSHSSCVAIGETGMDFYHDRVSPKTQKLRFIKHLELSLKYDLPVIVHCRDAEDSVQDILKQHGKETRGVLHCWAGGEALALQAFKLGWYVSLAGNLTFKNAQNLRDATARLPENRLLVETDCPFLTPHPYRGQLNHPGLLNHTAQQLASVRGLTEEETVRLTRNNTIELFRLPLRAQ